VTLLAFAVERKLLLCAVRRPPLSIGIFCGHGAQQQTRRSGVRPGHSSVA